MGSLMVSRHIAKCSRYNRSARAGNKEKKINPNILFTCRIECLIWSGCSRIPLSGPSTGRQAFARVYSEVPLALLARSFGSYGYSPRARSLTPVRFPFKSIRDMILQLRWNLMSPIGLLGIEPSLLGPKPSVLPVYDSPSSSQVCFSS